MAPTVPILSELEHAVGNTILSELEHAVGNMESKVSEMVSHAVEKAVGAMKHSLAELLHAGQDEIEAAVRRLERRITRASEQQEIMICSMKSDLEQFQAEMRSTIRNLDTMQAQTRDKREGATAESESVDKGTPYNDRGSYDQKLDMPLFDGTDPDGWILRVDQYFDFYKLTEAERLEAVVVALEGDAFKWYQWENRRQPIRRWEDLKILLLERKDFAQLDDETYTNGFASGEKTEELQKVGKSVSPQATAVEKILTKAEGKIPENLTSSSSDYTLSGRSMAAIENTSNFQQDVNSQSTFSASPSGESAGPIHTSWSNSRRETSNSFGNDTQLKIGESDKVDVKNTEKLEHVSSPLDNSTSAAVSASTASAFVSSTVPSENLNNGLFDSKPFSHSIPPNLPSSNSTEQVFGNSSTINHSLTSASMTSSSTSTSISSPSIFAGKPPSFPIVPATPPPSFSSEPVASLNFSFGASKTESSPAPSKSSIFMSFGASKTESSPAPLKSSIFSFGASKTESSPAPLKSPIFSFGSGTVETKSNEETPITNKPPSGGGFAFGSAFALETPITNKTPSGGGFAFGSAFALETPITNKPPSGGGFAFGSAFAPETPITNKPPSGGGFAFGSAFALETPITNKSPSGGAFAFGSVFALETPITNKPPSGGAFAFGSAFATNANAGNNPFGFCNSFASSSNNQSQAFLPGFGSSSTVSSQSLPTTGASTAITQSVPFPFGSSGSSTIFGTSGSSFTTNASVMGSSIPPANPFGLGTTVPTFGQPSVSQSPPTFNFGSAAPSIAASPLHFFGQQNQATPQNLPSFQTSNSLVNSGGSFSLGFRGGDKGNRKMVRISKNRNPCSRHLTTASFASAELRFKW